MAVVTSKGQITIPKAVREALNLVPGSEVEFAVEGGKAVLRRRVSPEAFERWRGYLRDRPPAGAETVDGLMDELRGKRPRDETATE